MITVGTKLSASDSEHKEFYDPKPVRRKENAMVPFELLQSIEEGGLMKLYLYSELPIEQRVAEALIRLTSCRSENWEKAMTVKEDEAVSVELSLEELAMILERVDFTSGRQEDIEAMNFWPHLLAAMEFLEALGFGWEDNDYGFDCHESYVLRWFVPEGMAGYLIWLLREGRSGPDVPAELRYMDFLTKRAALVNRLSVVLTQHVDSQ
jgi:hypothetical protein